MTRNIVYGTPGSGKKTEPQKATLTTQPAETEPQTSPKEKD